MFEWLEALKFWKPIVPIEVVSEEEFRQWSSLLTWVGELQGNLDSIENKWNELSVRNLNDIELLHSVQRIARNFGANYAKVKEKMLELNIEDKFTETLATVQLEYKFLSRKHPERNIKAQLQLVRETVIELEQEIKKIQPKRPRLV